MPERITYVRHRLALPDELSREGVPERMGVDSLLDPSLRGQALQKRTHVEESWAMIRLHSSSVRVSRGKRLPFSAAPVWLPSNTGHFSLEGKSNPYQPSA
jgi:hypothetical protein